MLLSSIPSPPIGYFDLGPVRIHFYALCILGGIIIATALTSRRMSSRGIRQGVVLDVALWAVPIGIVGGRLYHVVTHPNDYFSSGDNLWNIFAVWQGGLAIFGSILFGTIGAYIGCRRAGIHFFAFADALAPGLLLAQAFGRLGNYFNQELYGQPTTLPWGLQIAHSSVAFPPGVPAGTLFQPLFLYEMIWDVLGAVVIILIDRRVRLAFGQAIGLYFLWYGTGRAYLETLRIDPTEFQLLGVKVNTAIAILAAVLGAALLVIQSLRHRSKRLPGSPPADADAASSADSKFSATPS